MQALDEGIHSCFPNHKEAPLIGLTGNFSDGNLTLVRGIISLSFRPEGCR